MKDSWKLNFVILLIFSALSVVAAEHQNKPAGSFQLIENDFKSGAITRGDQIFFNIQSILAYNDLPDKYKSDYNEAVKCGTGYLTSVLENWDLLAEEQQSDLSRLLSRPPLDSVYMSPDGYFAVHYGFVYPDSVSDEDLNENEVPDFVERIGLYADSSCRFYHNDLGYYTPPPDSDGVYDIYLVALGPAYGVTVKEYGGDSSWSDFQSHIRINVNLSAAYDNDDPEGKIIGAQKVTCAHEYYHAVQMAYAFKNYADIWWTEGGATFFEDIVYDEVNDNYQYLPYFFNYADSFLIDTGFYQSFRDYSTFLFQSYLSEKFGIDIIKNVWEYLRFNEMLESIDLALDPYDYSMSTAFQEFAIWNYFTNDRADTLFHDDGNDYPTIDNILQFTPLCPFMDVTPLYPPDGLACNYLMAYPNTFADSGFLFLQFDGENAVQWDFSYIAFRDGDIEVMGDCEVDYTGQADCGIYNYLRYDSILFIPSVVSPWHDDNEYVFGTVVRPFGDADGSGVLNLLDITHLISFLYKGGFPPQYDFYMGDANCDGLVNILDVTYLIAHIYFDGPATCAYNY